MASVGKIPTDIEKYLIIGIIYQRFDGIKITTLKECLKCIGQPTPYLKSKLRYMQSYRIVDVRDGVVRLYRESGGMR